MGHGSLEVTKNFPKVQTCPEISCFQNVIWKTLSHILNGGKSVIWVEMWCTDIGIKPKLLIPTALRNHKRALFKC